MAAKLHYRMPDLMKMREHIREAHGGDFDQATPECPRCLELFTEAEKRVNIILDEKKK